MRKNRVKKSKTLTIETTHWIDYSGRLQLLETACKKFAIPMEVKRVWSRKRFFSWFRASLTFWLFVLKKSNEEASKKYCQLLAEIGPEAFNRPMFTHRNGITTRWKRAGKVLRDKMKAR